MYCTTDAIVLKNIPAGEADALYILYTKEFGKLTARASGIKKEGAKLRGHLELFGESRVMLVNGRAGYRIIGAESRTAYGALRNDPEGLAEAFHCVELIDAHCLPGERDEGVWDALSFGLEKLAAGAIPAAGYAEFRRDFERRMLEALGYAGADDLRVLPTAVV